MNQYNSVMNNLHRISHELADTQPDPNPRAGENDRKKQEESSVLDRALMRRYEDLLLTRKDLLEKLTADLENCTKKQQNMQAEYAGLEESSARLKSHLNTLQQNTCEFDPADQGRLAAECRMVEDIRLDLVRIHSGTEYPEAKNAERQVSASQSNFITELCSLSFPQLIKFGFAITLPLLIVLVLCCIIISVTYLLVFGGV